MGKSEKEGFSSDFCQKLFNTHKGPRLFTPTTEEDTYFIDVCCLCNKNSSIYKLHYRNDNNTKSLQLLDCQCICYAILLVP